MTPYEEKMWRRFWAKVDKTDACWLWTAATNPDGYGRFGIGQQLVYPHRLMAEQAYGPIPAGMVVDHLCRVPACVNPSHLEIVTMLENSRRGEHLSYRAQQTGVCKRGHSLAEHGYYRKGTHKLVRCRVCARDLRRAAKAAA